MKKLILSAAIILGSFTTFAQTSVVKKTVTTTQTVEEKYTEIKLEEVPSSVILALKTAQPTAVIEKAYINEKKEYKLDIKVDNQKATVYTDAAGNLKNK
ncbi:hypothetical protein DOS84_00510 [Flavobacterium aquariorum]|uniref:Beta-lactamase-inhibitor-like PepSY-like domain-containing protein n=1 Tax=Flavobacterium aquariorum TaxID=2217670 RepID=A0A2W7UNW5_9FLAO|nr:hypothetical protein [Flavobacterium aquariorum]PZX95085.1 hypothetical protein DOS84_00510 [Flavobacterium aquariorum]